MTTTMRSQDALSGSMGTCYATIDGERFQLMQAINIEAYVEKTKKAISIMGKTGKGHKTSGWEGTGSGTFYFNTSIFRKYILQYKETGKDLYFDMQFTNEDPTSSVGRQTVILKDCNIDKQLLIILDADAEYLEEEFDFTFDDFEIPEEFTNPEGMR